MIYFPEEHIDKKTIQKQINETLEDLNNIESSELEKKEILFGCLERISSSIDNLKNVDNTYTLFSMTDKAKQVYSALNSNIEELAVIKTMLYNIHDIAFSEFNISNDTLNLIKDFNNKHLSFRRNYFEVENNTTKFLNDYIKSCSFIFDESTIKSTQVISSSKYQSQDTVENSNSNINEEPEELNLESPLDQFKGTQISEISKEIEFSIDEFNSNFELQDNDLLLISEKEDKVYLPYLVSDLKKKLKRNPRKYSNLQDVINKEYILPMSKFRYPVISRFKEAFKLMKKREKSTTVQALDLALEVCFNSALNPAIIAACRNLNELDVYLDNLESDNTKNFSFFDIRYEVAPLLK